jgi:HEAT repeat protein
MNDKLDEIFSLLEKVRNFKTSGDVPEDLDGSLVTLARELGAGGKGSRGPERESIRQLLVEDDSLCGRLSGFLESDSPAARSWAGSFVEQLLPEEYARNQLLEALEDESDANSASWLSMNLARIAERPASKKICETIGKAHGRFADATFARRQIARAWGYAGCIQALSALAHDLESGGYDQMGVALDGMSALGSVDHKVTIDVLWETFDTVKWQDIRNKAAFLLTQRTHSRQEQSINRMIGVLINHELTEEHREASAKALSQADISGSLLEEKIEVLLTGLVVNRGSTQANILKVIKRSFEDWAERLARYAVLSGEEKVMSSLAHAIASDPNARRKAVHILKDYAESPENNIREFATGALKEIGGEEAFQSLKELLQNRYIKPSDDLQESSFKIFTDTMERMRKNYETIIAMNKAIFVIGIVVLVIGLSSALFAPDGGVVFGAVGVVAGLTTIVSVFLFGPLNRFQHALTELVQIEVAFLAYMHRLLQARSIFEQMYLSGEIDVDVLSRFDSLLENGMEKTVKLLEENITLPAK